MFEYGHIPIKSSFCANEQRWNIPESHIVDIWIREAKPGRVFTTNDGNEITICSIGKRNYSGGADFIGADILFNGNVIHGDIELHRYPKNWIQHGHHFDRMYESVILHVVLRNDIHLREVCRNIPSVPLVILEDNVRVSIPSLWQSVIGTHTHTPRNRNFLFCRDSADHISSYRKYAMLQMLAAQRFRKKCNKVFKRLCELRGANHNDPSRYYWKQLFYELLMESLGYANNKLSMRLLAEKLPYTFLIQIHFPQMSVSDRFIILLGTADLFSRITPELAIEEIVRVQRRWEELKKMYSIEADPAIRWNYGGLRPFNAPHRRLLSVAALLPFFLSDEFLYDMIETVASFTENNNHHRNQLRNLFSIPADQMIFRYHAPQFGNERIDEIITNIVAPFLFVMGYEQRYDSLSMNATRLYFHYQSGAHNSITSKAQKDLRVETNNLSGLRQGLIELHHSFCSTVQCQQCLIGRQQL